MTNESGMTDDEVEAEAALLDQAEKSRVQIRQTTQVFPHATISDAYRVQGAWQAIKLARGEALIGHKIGLTSRAMQQAMNITTPDSGFLTNAMAFSSGDQIPAANHLDAKVEVELAFCLAQDLEPAQVSHESFGVDTVLAATEYVVPALELIAARSFRQDPQTGRTRTVVDTIADNAADAGIIVGGRKVEVNEVDLRWVGALLSLDGVIEETGVAAGVLGHPAEGIVWLARRYASQGMLLRKGQLILAGSFTRPVAITAGSQILADYGDLGSIEIAFT